MFPMKSADVDAALAFSTSPVRIFTDMVERKAMTKILIARLNMAPMALSDRNFSLSITPKGKRGIVISAIVQNSMRTMNISRAVRNRIITAATTQTKPTRMVSRFFWLALSQKILKKFRALVTI